MPTADPKSVVHVAWAGQVSDYDDKHSKTHIRLLAADVENASNETMARTVLAIDPAAQPVRPFYRVSRPHAQLNRSSLERQRKSRFRSSCCYVACSDFATNSLAFGMRAMIA